MPPTFVGGKTSQSPGAGSRHTGDGPLSLRFRSSVSTLSFNRTNSVRVLTTAGSVVNLSRVEILRLNFFFIFFRSTSNFLSPRTSERRCMSLHASSNPRDRLDSDGTHGNAVGGSGSINLADPTGIFPTLTQSLIQLHGTTATPSRMPSFTYGASGHDVACASAAASATAGPRQSVGRHISLAASKHLSATVNKTRRHSNCPYDK